MEIFIKHKERFYLERLVKYREFNFNRSLSRNILFLQTETVSLFKDRSKK